MRGNVHLYNTSHITAFLFEGEGGNYMGCLGGQEGGKEDRKKRGFLVSICMGGVLRSDEIALRDGDILLCCCSVWYIN